MPTFAYTARDFSGNPVNGTLAANSIPEVTQMLRSEGKYPVSIRLADAVLHDSAKAFEAGIKVPRADVIQMTNQLAIMIETGVTISEALHCISAQAPKPQLKKLVDDLSQQVQGGADLSAALARHPASFPQLFVALIKASEKTGMLGKLLNRAASYLKDEQETLRRVKGALTYPLIMLGFAVTTTIFLLAFVLPRFATIYASKSAALPLPTKILMNSSDFIVNHYPALLSGVVTAFIGGYFYFSSSGGARLWYYLQLNIPLLGPMYRKLYLARGLRTLGTMAAAGVTLVESVQAAANICKNTYFCELWTSASQQIEQGKQLSEPMFASPLVPRSVCQMMSSAEKSGQLLRVMEQIATYSEQELKERIAEMTRYIEPVMIVVMGFIIGGVALAMLLPILTFSRVMGH